MTSSSHNALVEDSSTPVATSSEPLFAGAGPAGTASAGAGAAADMGIAAAADSTTAADSAATHFYGGQAVIDGVMMRGRKAWGLAVRQQSGAIVRRSFLIDDPAQRYPLLRWPVIRGMAALWDSLALGMRALSLSANLSLEGVQEQEGTAEPAPQLGKREMVVTIGIALLIAVGLFVVVPLLVARAFGSALDNAVLFNLVEGLVRIVIFLGYVIAISFMPDLRRVFEYHGAEHKTINAFEDGKPLDASAAQPYSTLHPRCGTAFLLVVMVVAILLFSLVGKPPLVWLILSRLVGIPIVAGLSYELIRYAGRHRQGFVARGVLAPGLGLQKLTTREPSPDQLQVAIAALKEVLRVEAGGEPNAGAPAEAGS